MLVPIQPEPGPARVARIAANALQFILQRLSKARGVVDEPFGKAPFVSDRRYAREFGLGLRLFRCLECAALAESRAAAHMAYSHTSCHSACARPFAEGAGGFCVSPWQQVAGQATAACCLRQCRLANFAKGMRTLGLGD